LPAPTGLAAEELLLDAWREALGEALDTERKQWARQRELIEAQALATILKLQAEIAELRSAVLTYARERLDGLQRQVSERLAQLRDGKDGDPGPAGERGEQGEQGLAGERGSAGERGEQGLQGPQGERGEAGAAGERGERGEQGPAGERGSAGERGEQGLQGPQGERGEAGAAGERGERGEAGERGEQGQQGLQGERGEQGLQGERGEAAERGEDGKQGEKGDQGEKGERGEKGESGEQGPVGGQGLPGEKGEQGERGLPGSDGAAGAPGTLSAAKRFEEGAVHYEGDVVLHLGSTYQARCDTARTPPHDDWQLIAAKGRDAAMPKIMGTYREGEAYSFLNIVALQGSSFIARTDDPGPCPGEGWQLIASAGKQGKQGQEGPRGLQGERGERGMPAAAIIGWHIDRAAYTATPIMSDGSEIEPLQLRELFEQFHDEAG
jgi:collagen triple helix repeat protein